MSDDVPNDQASPDDPTADQAGNDDAGRVGRLGSAVDSHRIQRYLLWAGVGLLVLLAAVATLRIYTNASEAIARFVAPDFQPIFQATFNLAVLLLALAGIGLLLRRLQSLA